MTQFSEKGLSHFCFYSIINKGKNQQKIKQKSELQYIKVGFRPYSLIKLVGFSPMKTKRYMLLFV